MIGVGSAPAADICEGCWEVGGRGGYLATSDDVGADSSALLGAAGQFHFRPYWSLAFALDLFPGEIPGGADETLTFLILSGAYTFRAAREQRTRPYGLVGAGLAYDRISSSTARIMTPSGPVTARSESASEAGFAYVLGGGGLSTLTERTWLRYEARWIQWSSFGIRQQAVALNVGLSVRLGRF